MASVAQELAGALQAAMLATGQPPTLEAIVYPASTALDQRGILKHVAETGSVTTGWCMETLDVVRDTAYRDLVDLVERNLLIRQGLGRGVVYVLREGASDDEIIR